jgi:hypothetical protein
MSEKEGHAKKWLSCVKRVSWGVEELVDVCGSLAIFRVWER